MAAASMLVEKSHSWLSELDSVSGDGDHGATMLRVVDRLKQSFTSDAPNFKTSFHDAGWSVLNADGGASSSLIGAFFMGMADAPAADASSLSCIGLARSFEAGLHAVKQNTNAKPGDKTMMDALVPAVETFVAAAQSGKEIGESLRQSAEAADTGAIATKNLTAHYGRARLLGEKTKGYQDPGATSIALMFQGFYQGFTDWKGDGK